LRGRRGWLCGGGAWRDCSGVDERKVIEVVQHRRGAVESFLRMNIGMSTGKGGRRVLT
jgi:hypothetical protein